jgi:hypothetical protein
MKLNTNPSTITVELFCSRISFSHNHRTDKSTVISQHLYILLKTRTRNKTSEWSYEKRNTKLRSNLTSQLQYSWEKLIDPQRLRLALANGPNRVGARPDPVSKTLCFQNIRRLVKCKNLLRPNPKLLIPCFWRSMFGVWDIAHCYRPQARRYRVRIAIFPRCRKSECVYSVHVCIFCWLECDFGAT